MEVMAVDTDTQMVVSEDGEEDRRVAAQPGPSGSSQYRKVTKKANRVKIEKRQIDNPTAPISPTSPTRPRGGGHMPSSGIYAPIYALHAIPQDVVRGRTGQVRTISMRNFMCHENLVVDLLPHVNAISGTNGSGKSATLQALQLCLGVRAKDTGRSASHSGLIKTGSRVAQVKVKLWNTGVDAYQPHLYGECIEVERKLYEDGKADTHLLNVMGKTVGTGNRALRAMLDHMGIDAGNPVTVLTQDRAREFLSGAQTGRKMYDFFLDATRIKEVQHELNLILNDLSDMKDRFTGSRHRTKEISTELRRKRVELDVIRGADLAQDALAALEKVRPWVEVFQGRDAVRELDGYLRDAKEGLAHFPEIHAVRQRDVDAATADHEAVQQRVLQAQQEVQEAQAEVDRLNARVKEVETAYVRGQEPLNNCQEEYRMTQTALENVRPDVAERKKAQTQQKLQSLAERSGRLNEQKDQIEADMAHLQQEKQRVDASRYTNMKDTSRVQARINAARKACTDAEDLLEHHRVTTAVAAKNRGMGSSNGGPGQWLKRSAQPYYGDLMAELKAQHQARRLEYMPVGPLGAYVEVLDKKWAKVLEAKLGPTLLGRFVCHSAGDQRVFEASWAKVVNRAKGKHQHAPATHQYAGNRAPVLPHLQDISTVVYSHTNPQYHPSEFPDLPRNMDSAYSQLRVPDRAARAVVLNQLVDAGRVENVGLWDGPKEEGYRIFQELRSTGKTNRGLAIVMPSLQTFRAMGHSVVTEDLYHRGGVKLKLHGEQDAAGTQRRLAELEQEARLRKDDLHQIERQLQQHEAEKRAIAKEANQLQDQLAAKEAEYQTVKVELTGLQAIDDDEDEHDRNPRGSSKKKKVDDDPIEDVNEQTRTLAENLDEASRQLTTMAAEQEKRRAARTEATRERREALQRLLDVKASAEAILREEEEKRRAMEEAKSRATAEEAREEVEEATLRKLEERKQEIMDVLGPTEANAVRVSGAEETVPKQLKPLLDYLRETGAIDNDTKPYDALTPYLAELSRTDSKIKDLRRVVREGAHMQTTHISLEERQEKVAELTTDYERRKGAENQVKVIYTKLKEAYEKREQDVY